MKKIIPKIILGIFATVIMTNEIAANNRTRAPLQRKKRVAEESPAMQVGKEVSILDQIAEQARVIVKAKGTKRAVDTTRSKARNELSRLMKDKDLEPKIKDLIASDIAIIQKTNFQNEAESKLAYKRLIATINAMDTEANVIDTIEEGRMAIERAPIHMKQEVLEQAVKNVQVAEAQAEEASNLNRMINGVKSTLAAPGNYFFGEQRSKAKTAFEATVGVLTLAAIAYGVYKVGPYVSQAASGLYDKTIGRDTSTTTEVPLTPQDLPLTGLENQPWPSQATKDVVTFGQGLSKAPNYEVLSTGVEGETFLPESTRDALRAKQAEIKLLGENYQAKIKSREEKYNTEYENAIKAAGERWVQEKENWEKIGKPVLNIATREFPEESGVAGETFLPERTNETGGAEQAEIKSFGENYRKKINAQKEKYNAEYQNAKKVIGKSWENGKETVRNIGKPLVNTYTREYPEESGLLDLPLSQKEEIQE
jgi:hypothetical protein